MASRRHGSRPDWDPHKETIRTLYVVENKTLEDVIKTMAECHGFHATKAQYIGRLKRWQMAKNSTSEKWKFAASQMVKRKLQGKESEVLINGKAVPAKKLKKETTRYALPTLLALEEPEATPELSEEVVVRTPPASAGPGVPSGSVFHIPPPVRGISVVYIGLPWFQFQNTMDAYIRREGSRTVPIERTAVHMSGSSSPYTTLLSPTWDPTSFIPGDTAEDWLQDVFANEAALGLDNILTMPQLSSNSDAEKDSREARSLLGLCLGLPIDPDSPEYVSEVSSALVSITAMQSHGGDVMQHVQQLCRGSASDALFHLLRYAVYLSSNNLLPDDKTDRLLQWVIDNNKLRVLERLLDAQGPTMETFASNILVSAARLDHIDAVRALLAKGAHPNSLHGLSAKSHALLAGVKNRNIQLVRLLLDAGADPDACEGVFQETALQIAMNEDLYGAASSTIAKTLIFHGADVLAPFDDGYNTILHCAVDLHDLNLVRAVLKAGARVDVPVSSCGTALQLAASHGLTDIARTLLDAGANVDGIAGDLYKNIAEEAAERWSGSYFQTPLQNAAMANATELVQILLDAGARVNGFPIVQHFLQPSCSLDGYGSCSCCSSIRDYEDDLELEVSDFSIDMRLFTALQAAARNCNITLARLLLNAGAEVDAIGSKGTALQVAASRRDGSELVQLLLDEGADVNCPAAQVRDSRTALQAAAASGDEHIVKLLLSRGAEVNAPPHPQGGRTAVQAAATVAGNLEIVKLLVDAGAIVHADAAATYGRTCLQGAAATGDIGVVCYLLQLGIDVNEPACPTNGRTSLQAAIEAKHVAVAEMLLEKGADVNGLPSEREGTTALEAALKNRMTDFAQLLLEKGADINPLPDRTRQRSPLEVVLQYEMYDFARLLLEKGANPNKSGSSLSTPLSISIGANAVDMVRRLVDAGADVNECFKSPCGIKTPLDAAVANQSMEVICILLDAGARIDGTYGARVLTGAVCRNNVDITKLLLSKGIHPDPYLNSEIESALGNLGSGDSFYGTIWFSYEDSGIPLQVAAKKGSLPLVEMLLQAGADVNLAGQGDKPRTALQWAVLSENVDVVVSLLNNGADINAPPGACWGVTALQAAAQRGNIPMIQLLLKRGADVNGQPSIKYGATALQFAVIKGHLGIVSMLLESGADINAPGAQEEGRTALEAAAEHGRLDIMYLLLQNDNDVETLEARCKKAAKLATSEGHAVLAKVLREWKASDS